MSFTPENLEFIKVMAKISGTDMSSFTNDIIRKYREEHSELFDKAKEIIDQL